MKFERIVVIGAGAVGGSIAALLQQSGHSVAIVARGAHGQAIQQAGLLFKSPNIKARCQIDVSLSIPDLGWRSTDIALLATKLQDAESALDELLAAAGDELPLVSVSNGLHGEEWATARFRNVISMLVWLPATHLQPGEVTLHSGASGPYGVLDCGVACGAKAANMMTQLCNALAHAGFDAVARDDIQDWKHAKWITNLGGAAQALVIDHWKTVAEAAQSEGVAILKAANRYPVTVEQLLARCSTVHMSDVDGKAREGGSTWQSYQRGLVLESPWLEGAIAVLAKSIGMDAPVNRRLADAASARRRVSAAEIL